VKIDFAKSFIKQHKKEFEESTSGKQLYGHILHQQTYEMNVLVPAGLIYNIVATALIYLYPEIFITNHYHIVLVFLQVLFGLLILKNSITSFKRRSELITNSLSNT